MNLDKIKAMFPNYHPEDYIFSVAPCCGSCKEGMRKTYCIECQLSGRVLEMFACGYCPQYKRNPDIKIPVVLKWIKSNQYGNGQG